MSDWIKMRAGLLTNPRVVRMARLLLGDAEFMAWFRPGDDVTGDVTRDAAVTKRDVSVVTRVVVGALLPTWSAVNDTAARDGIVRHAASLDIDEMSGVPGFSRALIGVDWVRELPDGDGIQFVNFEEHNSVQKERGLTAKSGAERQREYRERKNRESGSVTPRDDASDGDSDVTVTSHGDGREEKRREEKKKEKKPTASSSAVPTIPCPYGRIVALYHERLPALPRIKLMPKARQAALRKLWGWVLSSTKSDNSRRATTAEEALEWIGGYFGRAADNDFLMGRTPRTGEHANWRCDLDFLLTDRGKKHVIERTYDGEATA